MPLIREHLLQNALQGVQNWFLKQEMELFQQEMELLPRSGPAPTSTQLGLSLALVLASTPTWKPTQPRKK